MRSTQEAIRQYKHICWYPSAGKDFRSLLFLSDWYFRNNELALDEGQELPDLFVFTDYQGLSDYYEEEYGKEGFEFLKPGFRLIEKEYYSNSTTIDLLYSLKSRSLIPPAPISFLKIALAVQGLLYF